MTRRSGLLAAAALATLGAAPAPQPWGVWQTIAYQSPDTPAGLAALRRLGVTAIKLLGEHDDLHPPAPPAKAERARAAGLSCYVENIATDFYAPYHRWRPGLAVNAAFRAAERAHRADPATIAPFIRHPGLSDPAWRARIAHRLRATVAAWARFQPLYYSLGDETGIADLAANWDFDLSPDSLAAMRVWLRARYGSLAALNAEWGTDWRRWSEVTPETTDQAVAQHDDDFARWSDFKAWMDVAFARAVRAGTDAVHAADPAARAAIEGAQPPGFGGYDYTRLARTVDVMEIYDHDENLPIARAMNPRLITLMTVTGATPADRNALWRFRLQGGRGMIIWDDAHRLAGAGGAPGPLGTALAPVIAALSGAEGALLARAVPAASPVAILYSPASIRLRWLLARRAGGPPWESRGSAAEYDDPATRAPLTRDAALVRRAGLQPRYLSPAMITAGALTGPGAPRFLLLPDILALSDRDVAALRGFTRAGGILIADTPPGRFDAHGRARPAPPALTIRWTADFAALLAASPARPRARLLPPDGSVETWRYRLGDATLLAFLPDTGAPVTATLALDRPATLRDPLSNAPLGHTDRLTLRLAPDRPTLVEIAR